MFLKLPHLGTDQGFVSQDMIEKFVEVMCENDVLIIDGSNGSMDKVNMLYERCKDIGIKVRDTKNNRQ